MAHTHFCCTILISQFNTRVGLLGQYGRTAPSIWIRSCEFRGLASLTLGDSLCDLRARARAKVVGLGLSAHRGGHSSIMIQASQVLSSYAIGFD